MPEGKDVGKALELRPWQQEELRKIYDNPHGTRRAIISFGRKNGKTALAACLLLLHLVGPEARANSQLNSSAQSKDQAAILFKLAAKIVRLSPTLAPHVVIRDTIKELHCGGRGTTYKALSADASTNMGLSPVFLVHDELGQVKGPRSELYDALETAVGAHEAPLSIIISTQAPTDADLLSVLIDDAKDGNDPRVVLSLYTAPNKDDPFIESTIRKANPAFGDFLNATEAMAMAEDARRMPARQAQYENLVLNRRVEVSHPFVSKIVWAACNAKPRSIVGVPVYGGLDLAESRDLSAAVLIGQVDNVWQVHPTFWLPQDGLADKARADRVPYDLWHKSGHLLAAPGKTVDYEHVAIWLYGQFQKLDIRKIGFDDWNFRHLRPWLLKAGFTEKQLEDNFAPFGQGWKSMSPALRDLEVEIMNARIAHGDHPVMAMCAANAVVKTDTDGQNRKLSKAKSSGRIDGMVALAMALGVAPLIEAKPKQYQMVVI